MSSSRVDPQDYFILSESTLTRFSAGGHFVGGDVQPTFASKWAWCQRFASKRWAQQNRRRQWRCWWPREWRQRPGGPSGCRCCSRRQLRVLVYRAVRARVLSVLDGAGAAVFQEIPCLAKFHGVEAQCASAQDAVAPPGAVPGPVPAAPAHTQQVEAVQHWRNRQYMHGCLLFCYAILWPHCSALRFSRRLVPLLSRWCFILPHRVFSWREGPL
jgi:hypothetical protein